MLAAPRTATVRTLRDIHQRPVRQHSSFHWPHGMDFTTILPDHAHTCNFLAVDTSTVQVHCNFVLLHSNTPCFFRAHTIGVRSNSCNANGRLRSTSRRAALCCAQDLKPKTESCIVPWNRFVAVPVTLIVEQLEDVLTSCFKTEPAAHSHGDL